MDYSRDATASYFNSVAEKYSEESYGADTPNARRLEIVKSIFASEPKGRVLDAGCGAGDLLCHLAGQGFDVAGTDLAANMADVTRRRLAEAGRPDATVLATPLSDLSAFADDSVDAVTVLGVLPYVPEDQEDACYAEMTRVLKPGGLFVAAYQNELFDLFTFNRYTLRFFRNNVFPLLAAQPGGGALDFGEMERKLAGLLVHPDKPTQTQEAQSSQRGHVFTRPENPLSVFEKLRRHGLVWRTHYYYNFHAAPPLIQGDLQGAKEAARALEIAQAQHWLGMFMASTFISVARLEG